MKSEQEIVCWEKIKQSDHLSFAKLFDCYWEALFQYAYRVLKCRENAEEVVQELFINLWNKRESLPEVKTVSAYLFTALKNRILNQLAKRKLSYGSINEAAEIASTSSATCIINKKEIEKTLRLEISQLPRKMQQVYVMYYFDELNIDEIANSTGNSPQTVRNQINTASKKLNKALKIADLMPLLGCLYIFL